MKEEILTVTISKTSKGSMDYMQIISEDMMRINIVLVADKIKIEERREEVNGH